MADNGNQQFVPIQRTVQPAINNMADNGKNLVIPRIIKDLVCVIIYYYNRTIDPGSAPTIAPVH